MTDRERLLSRVSGTLLGCLEWQGSLANGYGRISIGGKATPVHRAAYELFVGQIPDGLTIDHLCRNRACVNVLHLEAVSGKENSLRGTNPLANNARKTHCDRGHEFTAENTYHSSKGRECRTCRDEDSRKRWGPRKIARRGRRFRYEQQVVGWAVRDHATGALLKWFPGRGAAREFERDLNEREEGRAGSAVAVGDSQPPEHSAPPVARAASSEPGEPA